MFTMKLELVDDYTEELERRLKELAGSEVDIGMFAEQGQHYSGRSYVGLFKYHATGDPSKRIPPRPALYIAANLNPLSSSPLKSDLRSYLSNLNSKGKKDSDDVLKGTGEYYRGRVRDVFGDEGQLDEKSTYTKSISESPNTPLIETGSLKSKVAYRINNGAIRE